MSTLQLPWTRDLKWGQVINIRSVGGEGKYWDERLELAQRALAEEGGGVVFFPMGEYPFADFIKLGDGIVLRGEAPEKVDAHDPAFAPPARLTFPEYTPLFEGDGTPIDTAFKGIVLQEPATASNCGVVHLSIDRGHIHLSEAGGHRCGRNRIVFGCLLTNAAVADPNIRRSKKIEQPGWHRVIIRDNYIYNTGRMAIGFSGDGTICSNNVIRFEKDVIRPTVTGDKVTKRSSTNDNRAIEARGWRWVIDGNDYLVDRNICADGSYRINDGEGIMHEDHCNSDIRGSRLTNNKGNSYLSLYKCGTIDGLHIEGNQGYGS